jgi:hypothetical protein
MLLVGTKVGGVIMSKRNIWNDDRYEGMYMKSLDPAYDTEVKRPYRPVCIECTKPMSYEEGQDGMCTKCIDIYVEEA